LTIDLDIFQVDSPNLKNFTFEVGRTNPKGVLGSTLNYNEIGDYSIMRVEKDLPVTDFNVGVASAISSYSRCRLWSLINDIESKGKQIFMCDTDSVITDCDLS